MATHVATPTHKVPLGEAQLACVCTVRAVLCGFRGVGPLRARDPSVNPCIRIISHHPRSEHTRIIVKLEAGALSTDRF